ncbi:hypothetical protein D3C85_1864130 [compost metagenome]
MTESVKTVDQRLIASRLSGETLSLDLHHAGVVFGFGLFLESKVVLIAKHLGLLQGVQVLKLLL